MPHLDDLGMAAVLVGVVAGEEQRRVAALVGSVDVRTRGEQPGHDRRTTEPGGLHERRHAAGAGGIHVGRRRQRFDGAHVAGPDRLFE